MDPIARPRPPTGMARLSWRLMSVTFGLALAIALLSGLLWWSWNRPVHPPDATGQVAGMAYNAFQRWDSPLQQRFPIDEAIDADLRLLSQYTRRLRTYSASEFPALPAIAQRHGLRLTAGVWLDRRLPANEKELAAIEMAVAAHPNIDRVIAGNETLLQDKLSLHQLSDYLDRLRRSLPVPVSTAEPWHVWLDHPELASRVDFIAVHLLPYWEGLPIDAALPYAMQRYRELQVRFPDKPIVIAEIGWPGGDFYFGGARATPANQARFVREFLKVAEGANLDYYLMEAVDQPWKAATEGRVGAHWGFLDARRNPKFELQGAVERDAYWRGHAIVATVLALLPLLPLMLLFPSMRLVGRITFALSALLVATFAVMMATRPLADYLSPIDLAFYSLLVPALLLMGALFLAVMLEFAELFWSGSLRQVVRPAAVQGKTLPDGSPLPWVSVHVACCNEPPAMVLSTLRSLCAIDWPHLEILIVDNNTSDDALWIPVRDQVLALDDPRVKFFHLPRWPGFKAGALNFALAHTDPRASWIAVVDADYVVAPDWLRQMAEYLAQPDVAAVQAPQAHRDWEGHTAARLMNWEYEGFFRLGMHHRHERNALIQHGTMILLNRQALMQAGQWDPDCVCEDAELGLRLLMQGQRIVYVDRVLGQGLVPHDWKAYRRQRRRWAMGGMQILRRHAGALWGRGPLTLAQRYHFIAGWLPWAGDALHLCFSVLALAWTIGLLLAPAMFNVPMPLLLVPLILFATVRLVLGPLLYFKRVPCSTRDVLGAAIAGMSLSHAIARGVLTGLFSRSLRFEVTTKRLAQAMQPASPSSPSSDDVQTAASQPAPIIPRRLRRVREEAGEECLLLSSLLAAMAALLLQTRQPLDGALLAWVGVLALQALPYAVTVMLTFAVDSHRTSDASALPERQHRKVDPAE
jgi:exo-beta-1,3-glucanase (GH17 family)/cellulose synthase/poly-beta-1,6-N-acetylglucosamine synthase-like glycosyltransferase